IHPFANSKLFQSTMRRNGEMIGPPSAQRLLSGCPLEADCETKIKAAPRYRYEPLMQSLKAHPRLQSTWAEVHTNMSTPFLGEFDIVNAAVPADRGRDHRPIRRTLICPSARSCGILGVPL